MPQEFFIPWLSLLVAIVSSYVALYSVFLSRKTAETSRKMTQKQATLDFLEKYENDSTSEAGKLLPDLLSKKDIWFDATYASELKSFISFLSRYDKLALGLKHEVYDDQMVFDAIGKDVVGMYQLTETFIKQTRDKMRMISGMLGVDFNEKVFFYFEALAKEYKARLAP